MNLYLQRNPKQFHILFWLISWTLLVLTSLFLRGFFPVDETRYVSVAWEMWVRQDFLLPTINFAPYSHKPPLMFWLFQIGWSVFGVNDWWPRIVPSFFALFSLFLTGKIAQQLWPQKTNMAWQAPTILLGCLFWTIYTPAMMFDMILTFFVLLAIFGLLYTLLQQKALGWWLFALGVGLGILTKGPVILLHIAFPALLAPVIFKSQINSSLKVWYLKLFFFLLIGILIPLLWAIPAAIKGGDAYTHEIFLSQTVNRVQQSFAHQRPWYWYLPLLPILLAPWLLMPVVWVKIKNCCKGGLDASTRFILAWLVPTFICFCLISGKQVHYLLPLFPAFALLIARLLTEQVSFSRKNQILIAVFILAASLLYLCLPFISTHIKKIPPWLSLLSPWWGIVGVFLGLWLLSFKELSYYVFYSFMTFTSVCLVLLVIVGIIRVANIAYDLQPIADKLNVLHQQGKSIIHLASYHGQYQYLAKLTSPLQIESDCHKMQLVQENPDSWFIDYIKPTVDYKVPPEYSQFYRNKIVALWHSSTLLANQDNPKLFYRCK